MGNSNSKDGSKNDESPSAVDENEEDLSSSNKNSNTKTQAKKPSYYTMIKQSYQPILNLKWEKILPLKRAHIKLNRSGYVFTVKWLKKNKVHLSRM